MNGEPALVLLAMDRGCLSYLCDFTRESTLSRFLVVRCKDNNVWPQLLLKKRRGQCFNESIPIAFGRQVTENKNRRTESDVVT